MASTRWKDIYNFLKSKGYDVYAPAQHEGECLSSYIVVKLDTSSQVGKLSSDQQKYTLMAYVPKDKYSELEDYVEGIKRDMREMFPMIVSVRFQTASYYDDAVKGHMVSLQYRNNRKV